MCIKISKQLIENHYINVNIDELIKDIQDYIQDRYDAYNKMNKQMEEELPKLFNKT